MQTIANHSFKILVSLKLLVIENKQHLSADELATAARHLNQRYSWAGSVNFLEPKVLRSKVVSSLPDFLVKQLLNVRNALRDR